VVRLALFVEGQRITELLDDDAPEFQRPDDLDPTGPAEQPAGDLFQPVDPEPPTIDWSSWS
jgi:hypothetical protein